MRRRIPPPPSQFLCIWLFVCECVRKHFIKVIGHFCLAAPLNFLTDIWKLISGKQISFWTLAAQKQRKEIASGVRWDQFFQKYFGIELVKGDINFEIGWGKKTKQEQNGRKIHAFELLVFSKLGTVIFKANLKEIRKIMLGNVVGENNTNILLYCSTLLCHFNTLPGFFPKWNGSLSNNDHCLVLQPIHHSPDFIQNN